MPNKQTELTKLFSKLPSNYYVCQCKLWCGDIGVDIDYIDYVGGPLDYKKAVLRMLGKLRELTCTQCNKVKETYDELEYSQGRLVCLDCKEEFKEVDKIAFDRDIMQGRTY